MNIRAICYTLILGGLLATIAPATPSLAQSTAPATPAPAGAGAPAGAATTPNTNTNPTKHRYWRHRGGKHPHYGSRRVTT
jgi:hypothetical protein